MQIRSVIALFILTLVLYGCVSKQDKSDFEQFAKLDSILQTSPETVCDSLKKIDTKKLSQYNFGYYRLLDVISKDKTYYDFKSDSLINQSFKILSRKKNKYPINYIRSLMYQGIVRYRMGISDSTAYKPIKLASEFLNKKRITNLNLQYLCYYYLGAIHAKNSNLNYSISYFEKAINAAETAHNKNYIYNAYIESAWVYMRLSKPADAKRCIDKIFALKDLSKTEYDEIRIVLSSYYDINKEPQKALEINKKILKNEILTGGDYLSTVYLKIAKNYHQLNNIDSAYFYSKLAEKNIKDQSKDLNYLLYGYVGQFAEKLELWQSSAEAFKKAYELRDKAINKEVDKRVMELEKKYDLTEAENKLLHFRNRIILVSLFSVFLIIFLIFITVFLRQSEKNAEMKILLAEQKNKLLEQDKITMEHKLIENEFILPLYQQISQRNAKVKSLLSDLTTNTYLIKNQHLSKIINEAYQEYTTVSTLKSNELLSNEKFREFTGISSENSKNLNDSEKILLVFLTMELDNKQIAVLFNTSESSIRGRKTKLRSKLEALNISLKVVDV